MWLEIPQTQSTRSILARNILVVIEKSEAKPTLGDANDALQALKDKMDGK